MFPPPVLIPQVLETSEETMYAGVDCSTLSETMLVPNSTRTPGRHPRKLHGRCWHKGMQYKIYQSRVSKSGKWKFQVWFQKEKVHLESPGLYQAGKENLNRQRRYLTRLVIYRSWCDRRHNSPYSASVDDLAKFFFVYLHEERGCKTNTAAGYITAIATIYAEWRGRSVNSNADLLSLI